MTNRRPVRWRWLLPILMTAIVFLLLWYAQVEYNRPDCPLRGYDSPGDMEAPAVLLAKLFGGPAFYPFVPLSNDVIWIVGVAVQLGFLVPVAVLWFWIGFEIDNRKRDLPSQRRRKWLLLVASALLTLACSFLAYVHIYELWRETMFPWQRLFQWELKQPSFVRFLWSPGLSNYPQLAWMIVGIIFFGSRFARLVRPRPLAVQESTGGNSPPPPVPTF